VQPTEIFHRAVEALLTRSVDERFRFGLDLVLDAAGQIARTADGPPTAT
jgi:hypothetical protein